jgi:tetratricopeptide (TPR) repeat protein
MRRARSGPGLVGFLLSLTGLAGCSREPAPTPAPAPAPAAALPPPFTESERAALVRRTAAPLPPERQALWNRLGETHRARRFGEALALARALRAADGEDGRAWFWEGYLLYLTWDFRAAAPLLEGALARAGDLETVKQAHEALVYVLHRLGRYADSEASARTLLRLDPGSMHGLSGLWRNAFARTRWDEALSWLRLHLARAPDDEDALEALGEIHRERGEDAAARAALERLERTHPRNASAPYQLGLLALRRGEAGWPEAEARFRAALERDDAHLGAWMNLGRLLQRMGRADEARAALEHHKQIAVQADELEHYRALLRKTPGDVELRIALAVEYRKRGRPAQARRELERVLEAAPGHAAAWLQLGLALRDLRETGEARRALEEAARRAPGSAEVEEALRSLNAPR